MTRLSHGTHFAFLSLVLLLCACAVHAQVNPDQFKALKWRGIGPYRGGRSTAVAGDANNRLVFYMGATGGGVWKTTDGGISWRSVSDGIFKTGSVGAIAVSMSDSNTIYVGMGEACLRANISHGDGVYKSTDGGKTWNNVGLRDTSQIGKLRIDPRNPDVAYVAAVGHPYGPNEERGVFRTRDGGKSWQKVLYVNDKTGAVDIAMDPRDPLTLYATTWQVLRTPWDITSIGPGGGIYKTTDGGDTWTQLKAGLPKGDKGKIGIIVSPVNSKRVWATVEAEPDGGIYRSDDAGATWTLMNGSFDVRSRQYYYGHIFADPSEADTVYTFSSKHFLKSTDGGKTYTHVNTPHGDYHDLWIDPKDRLRMIDGDDGGGDVSFDGGSSWSSENNQPTAQFYTVSTDNAFPYHVYGAQQDNSTVGIASRTSGPGIDVPDWFEVGGGESGYVEADPEDPNIVYAGAFWGLLTRYDHRNGSVRNISAWPDLPGGRLASQLKYRFQWTYPIAVSTAEPGAVYIGSNILLKSTDRGQSWKEVSPDLTRDNKDRENGRLEDVYSTIFTIALSPLDKNVIWTGSDDGLIHLTQDGGKTWADVTPPAVQPWTRINIIEASPHDAQTAYVAANRYQTDDFKPYIYRTHDSGKTWTLVSSGIAEDAFVRAVRQDRIRKDLLYAATETGVYVSFDDGDKWQSLQLNLPVVPVTDLTVKDNDVVISTQGRSFWILDDISPLQQLTAEVAASKVYLFRPRPAYRTSGGGGEGEISAGNLGQNPPSSLIVYYSLAEASAQPVSLEFEDANGAAIESFSSDAKPKDDDGAVVTAAAGLNRFVWDMRYPDGRGVDGKTYFLGGTLTGPRVVPASYKVKLTAGGQTFTQDFEIKKDPRLTTTDAEYAKQFQMSLAVRDKVSELDDAVNRINRILKQLESASQSANADKAIRDAASNLTEELIAVRQKLIEPRFTGFDDQTLIFPLQLNNRLASLQGYLEGDHAPTDQDAAVFQQLSSDLGQAFSKLKQILETDVPPFNSRLKSRGLPALSLD
jgi:photosystem II stability/assembly factor-like uncharacterized protein